MSVLLVVRETRHGCVYSNLPLTADIVPEKDHSWEDRGHWGIWEVGKCSHFSDSLNLIKLYFLLLNKRNV